MAFSFQVIADPTIDPNLVKDAEYALGQWSNVIDGQGTLSVDLRVTTTTVSRADNDTTQVTTASTDSGRTVSLSSPAYELTTGQHATNLPDGSSSDLVVNIDPAYLQTLFVDPNPSAASVIPSDKLDAVSVIEHEIGHGLGMVGFYPAGATSTNDLPSTYESKFDSFVQFQNGQPVFVGPNAEAANGGKPVPLTDYATSNPNSTQNFYHLGSSLLDPFGNDLMTGSPFQYGMRYAVSAVDAGIVEDASGLTAATVPNPPPTVPADSGSPATMGFIHHHHHHQPDHDHKTWGHGDATQAALASADFNAVSAGVTRDMPRSPRAMGAWDDVGCHVQMAGHTS